jgi:DNA-binding NarL/FixJ family response regulator
METILQKDQSSESVNILLIGNNPIEMSTMLETIAKVPGRKIITEIAFDVKSSWARLLKFQPNFILIDDNIGRKELSQTVDSLTHNSKTCDIPITVLKNSNYEEAVVSADIMDYLLKKNLTADSLYNAIKNTLKFRRTRTYLMEAYNKRKGQILQLVG